MITINIENTIENCMILLLFAFAYVIITTGIAKVTTRNDKESMTAVAWVIGGLLYIITVAAFIIIE
jgi:hypothetical protein